MPTKLSRFCEGIMEAAWLAAVIVVPVFFNVYSSRIFEPDKIALLRSLALLVLAAWIVKLIEERPGSGESLIPSRSWFRSLARIPLLLPVLALAALYLISTLFSVSPGVSFWGSYQRLQGAYSTFSYLVIFASIMGNLRRREQLDRLVTTAILASLPVSFYGVLQRYGIDPVPWGGDVTIRIAANMGNSIFVAAYLIMAFPLTALRVVDSFNAILNQRERLLPNFTRATAYVFIAALQVIALIFSASRGPLLGWLASVFFIVIVLSLLWRQRWMTLGAVGVAALLGGFLIVFNIPQGPLESLRSVPGIGRLGHLLDEQSSTGRVRTLIWKGAAELVRPHEPLEFPDGRKDAFNVLRPLIGYGPETMYVAYNRFYPPELTQVEKRNASPDRSHNETWDSLVITGVLGLAVYLTVFGSIFYHGLKWLGLVNGPRQRNLFLALYVGGGAASAFGFVLWKGLGYFGVGLPFGMIVGVILYLILVALFGQYDVPQSLEGRARSLTILGILAVIIAHFVEINFGIAIAATRTYFWIFSGLLLVAGCFLTQETETGSAEVGVLENSQRIEGGSQKKKRRAARPAARPDRRPARPSWLGEALTGGLVIAVLLVTLGFDFISFTQAGSSAGAILWSSLVRLRDAQSTPSYGVLAMVVLAWLVGAAVFASESAYSQAGGTWAKTLAAILGISAAPALVYWLLHAAALGSISASTPSTVEEVLVKVSQYEGLLSLYYSFLLLLIFALAYALAWKDPGRLRSSTLAGVLAAPVALALVLWMASYTNMRTVQADIAFKLADPFARGNSWPVAIDVYNRANRLAPGEDFYYLFLGRAYLEEAKTLGDAAQREELLKRAAQDLKKAQTLNPLNTDHTANLGRLYSQWASYTEDAKSRGEIASLSSDYFSRAISLSPNNARIWDEWAVLYMNVFQDPEQANQLLVHSLALDPYYDWTHVLLGEYYYRTGQELDGETEKADAYQQAERSYREAIRLAPDDQTRLNYLLSLGQMYITLEQPRQAITAIEEALRLSPQGADSWRYEQSLAQLYAQTGDQDQALLHANRALALAPADQQAAVQELIGQLQK
jgi:tetratricopeptide (TPR) repeat protein/O-antigen ligase